MKLTEALLDQVHRLHQKRLAEIEDHGEPVTLIPQQEQLKTMRQRDTWFFSVDAPVKVGQRLSHVDDGHFVVTATEQQAGRIACEVLNLPLCASFFTAIPRSVDILNRTHYTLDPQNWSGVPCTIRGSKIVLPAHFLPIKGDIIIIDQVVYKVTAAKRNEATAVAEVIEFE